jgi:protein-S-isoprenylcysteine O-methyltransferase Ste14
MRRSFAIVGKAVVIVAVWVTIGCLVGYLRPLDASLGTELPAWVQAPGIAAILAGAAGVLGCGVILSTVGIGTLGGAEWFMPQEFVATGPFRFVRNPMSLAGVILMVGIAVYHRSSLGLGLAVALLFVFHLVIVYVEEPGLEKRFGESYREYKRHVPQWLPRWRPWPGRSVESSAKSQP